MLDNLFSLFPKKEALVLLKEFLSKAEEVFTLFEKDYIKDQNLRNAAIDTLIDLLNSLKEEAEEKKTETTESKDS